MKNYKKMIMVLLVTLAFGLATITDVMAKSSRSRSTTRSAPKRSAPKKAPAKKSWGTNKDTSKTKAAPVKKGTAWGNKKKSSKSTARSTKPVKRTAAQQKSFETAKKNGTAFSSKADAMKSFKSKNSTKYKSTYATRPSVRPSHIPSNYSVGGRSYSVVYHNGGYRYQNSLGAWMIYDAFSDAIMYNALMKQNHYHYDPVVAARPIVVQPRRVVVRERSYAGLIATVAIIAIVVTGFVIVNKKKNNG